MSEQTPRAIFADPASKRAREMLAATDRYTLTNDPRQAELFWLRRKYRGAYGLLDEHHLLNHIPGEGIMSRKGDLTSLLNQSLALAGPDDYSPRHFYQPSYNLSDPQQKQAFLAQLPAQDREENLWILKPARLSRGIGVRILWELDGLREELQRSESGQLELDGEKTDYIIQRYIRDVLLLRKRKSEFRLYWLIASVDPLLVFVYPEGTVRFTAQEFKLGDYDNPAIHLTNTYQQKKGENFKPEEVLKWDFAQLQAYVHEELNLAAADWLYRDMLPKARRSLGYVARAAQPHMARQQPRQGHFFALLGADFILDQQLNPWLTEVQKGPGLVFADPVKQKLIPPMLREAVDIAFEVADRKRTGASLEKLEAVDRFIAC